MSSSRRKSRYLESSRLGRFGSTMSYLVTSRLRQRTTHQTTSIPGKNARAARERVEYDFCDVVTGDAARRV
jgi:hypothetical protein